MLTLHDTEINTRQSDLGASNSRANESRARVADPCVVVIFGASDLAKRKLYPAVCDLAKSGLLRDEFCIVGVARGSLSREQFRASVNESICRQVQSDPDVTSSVCNWIIERVDYVIGDYYDTCPYDDLRQTLSQLDKERNTRGNYLFYLATSPDLFLTIVRQLDAYGLAKEGQGWRRFIIEKPFGNDLHSAKELNRELLKIVNERQLYRIDHYLGKQTVQNILVFRFSNSIFEPVWNCRLVDHVQITVAVGSRASRCVLRQGWCIAGHGTKPLDAVEISYRNGTTSFFSRSAG